MVYLISYDLVDKSEEFYTNLIKEIILFGDYCKILQSQWLVSTPHDANFIYNKLTPHIIGEDHIFVNEINSNFQGWIGNDCIQWLKLHGIG